MIVMTVDEFAQFGMVTLRTGFLRQIRLVIGGKFCIKFCCMT
jgi:hypothetical protein